MKNLRSILCCILMIFCSGFIFVACDFGGKTITSNVSFTAGEVSSYEFKNVDITYDVGDTFTITNGTLVLTMKDNKIEEIELKDTMIKSLPDMNTAGEKEVVVIYKDVEFKITITINKVQTLTVKSSTFENTKTNYERYETFSVVGAKLVLTMSDDSQQKIDITNAMVKTMPDMTTTGVKTITIVYNQQEYTYPINVDIDSVTKAKNDYTTKLNAFLNKNVDLDTSVYDVLMTGELTGTFSGKNILNEKNINKDLSSSMYDFSEIQITTSNKILAYIMKGIEDKVMYDLSNMALDNTTGTLIVDKGEAKQKVNTKDLFNSIFEEINFGQIIEEASTNFLIEEVSCNITSLIVEILPFNTPENFDKLNKIVTGIIVNSIQNGDLALSNEDIAKICALYLEDENEDGIILGQLVTILFNSISQGDMDFDGLIEFFDTCSDTIAEDSQKEGDKYDKKSNIAKEFSVIVNSLKVYDTNKNIKVLSQSINISLENIISNLDSNNAIVVIETLGDLIELLPYMVEGDFTKMEEESGIFTSIIDFTVCAKLGLPAQYNGFAALLGNSIAQLLDGEFDRYEFIEKYADILGIEDIETTLANNENPELVSKLAEKVLSDCQGVLIEYFGESDVEGFCSNIKDLACLIDLAWWNEEVKQVEVMDSICDILDDVWSMLDKNDLGNVWTAIAGWFLFDVFDTDNSESIKENIENFFSNELYYAVDMVMNACGMKKSEFNEIAYAVNMISSYMIDLKNGEDFDIIAKNIQDLNKKLCGDKDSTFNVFIINNVVSSLAIAIEAQNNDLFNKSIVVNFLQNMSDYNKSLSEAVGDDYDSISKDFMLIKEIYEKALEIEDVDSFDEFLDVLYTNLRAVNEDIDSKIDSEILLKSALYDFYKIGMYGALFVSNYEDVIRVVLDDSSTPIDLVVAIAKNQKRMITEYITDLMIQFIPNLDKENVASIVEETLDEAFEGEFDLDVFVNKVLLMVKTDLILSEENNPENIADETNALVGFAMILDVVLGVEIDYTALMKANINDEINYDTFIEPMLQNQDINKILTFDDTTLMNEFDEDGNIVNQQITFVINIDFTIGIPAQNTSLLQILGALQFNINIGNVIVE